MQVKLLISETEISGVFLVYRKPNELPFAQLTAPKARPARRDGKQPRKWGIIYRDTTPGSDPFRRENFNICPKNKSDAIFELEMVARYWRDDELLPKTQLTNN